MGGLFFYFGQVRTESRHTAAALSRRLSDGRLDGVAATWPRDDAIFMILKFKQTLTQHRKTSTAPPGPCPDVTYLKVPLGSGALRCSPIGVLSELY